MSFAGPDRGALSDLVHRYAACTDDRQFDSIATLFTATAELVLPEPPAELEPIQVHRGPEAIAAAIAAVARTIRTQHAIVGEVYDHGPRADRAHGRIACIAHHWNHRADEVVDIRWHVRYDDDYERTEAGWRISRRALTVHAIEIHPARRVLPHAPS